MYKEAEIPASLIATFICHEETPAASADKNIKHFEELLLSPIESGEDILRFHRFVGRLYGNLFLLKVLESKNKFSGTLTPFH